MVYWDVNDIIMLTSYNLDCASTTTKNILQRNGPAQSTWLQVHRAFGHTHKCSGAAAGLDLIVWQAVHSTSSNS